MENNNYVFLADAFGYGPITTLCQIVIELKKQLKGNYIFTGPKMCISQAKKYNIFHEFIEMNYTNNEIDQNKEVFLSANKIIAVETTDILIYLINHYKIKNIYLIDNLFWMWDYLEPELKEIQKYYISNVIDCSSNIKRIAKDFNNLVTVGALRQMHNFKKITKNDLIISLGGAESYMFAENDIDNYYLNTVKEILETKYINKFSKIYIAGGESIIRYLKKNIVNEKVEIKTYNNSEYLNILYNCSHAIMSPGLGNFNEVISTDIKCLFLLPINYSQYLQRNIYKSLNIGFHFQENNKEKYIVKYLNEEEGVQKVIDNLKCYDFYTFKDELASYFEDITNTMKREKFYNSIDKYGIKEVCSDILKEEL